DAASSKVREAAPQTRHETQRPEKREEQHQARAVLLGRVHDPHAAGPELVEDDVLAQKAAPRSLGRLHAPSLPGSLRPRPGVDGLVVIGGGRPDAARGPAARRSRSRGSALAWPAR